MAFKSDTFVVRTINASAGRTKKRTLERRHKQAMDKVVADARTLVEDRRRTLDEIDESVPRLSAAR